jgi:NAD(P)-dependent dehydrogenase (short-subunit alcohol dehydrogenase family)
VAAAGFPKAWSRGWLNLIVFSIGTIRVPCHSSGMSGRLDGKTALITGGSSGIGLATAKLFVAEGARVLVVGRDRGKLDAAVKEIGPGATPISADVSIITDLERLMAEVKKAVGRIDILFANAGVGSFVPLEKVTEEYFDRCFDANVKGTFFTVQKALPLMAAGGSIVITGSMMSVKGVEAFGVYSATKAAIRSFARSMCVDLKGRGIRVNVISPGKIVTERYSNELGWSELQIEDFKAHNAALTPLGRTGEPEEIASAVLFLASAESSFITGTELFVDGGLAQI